MVDQKVEGEILVLTINRPKAMNAINEQVMDDLHEIFVLKESHLNYRAVLITGAGEKAFAAGADIKEFPNYGVSEGTSLSAKGHKVYDHIERATVPVLAVVNGFALGGGCELTMACHMRIAEEKAKFGQPEINLGLIPGYGGTQRLQRYIGRPKAIELLLTGDMISAKEALQLGLINRVVPNGEGYEAGMELLQKMSAQSKVVVAKMLETVHAYQNNETDFAVEIDGFGECFGFDDMREGVAAFMEKRKPNFSDQ